MELSVYLARQPIFDAEGRICAYELLYRDTDENHTLVTDNIHATARVLVNALNYIGLNTLTKGHIAFVKCDGKTLMEDIVYSISPTRFVLELLEESAIDANLLKRIDYLRSRGYRFALSHCDGKSMIPADAAPLLKLVDFVKIDLSRCDDPETLIASLQEYPVEFIAERIEEETMFEKAKAAGFHRFQGYFFARPFMMKKARVDPESSQILDIVYRLRTNAPLETIIQKFNASPYLTLNLLKFIRLHEGLGADAVASVEQALILIGRERLTNWLELLVYAYEQDESEGGDYAKQLSRQATQRAYLMQELAHRLNSSDRFAHAAYMTGLLSMSEVMFQESFDTILKQMNVDANIASALLRHNGKLGQLLELAIAVERDNITTINSILGQLTLSQEDLNSCMLASYQRGAKSL